MFSLSCLCIYQLQHCVYILHSSVSELYVVFDSEGVRMECKRRVSARDDYRSNVHEHLAHLHRKQRLFDLDRSAVSLYNSSLLFLHNQVCTLDGLRTYVVIRTYSTIHNGQLVRIFCQCFP